MTVARAHELYMVAVQVFFGALGGPGLYGAVADCG